MELGSFQWWPIKEAMGTNRTRHGPRQPSLADPALSRTLNEMISRGSAQPHLFCNNYHVA